MRLILTLSAVLVPLFAVAAEDGLSFKVDNFSTDGDRSVLTIAVTNGTTRSFRAVTMSCAFMNAEGRALDIGHANVSNIQPGETAWTQASIRGFTGIEKAQCRFDNTL